MLRQTKSAHKAKWLIAAMDRMDQRLEPAKRQEIREACACCKGGLRLKQSKAICATGRTLEERIELANKAKLVFGHSVVRLSSGPIQVSFGPDDLPSYRCVCLPGAQEPVSPTYCLCCLGHVKHHLQTALGTPLKGRLLSSALVSQGTRTCSFEFEIVEER